MENKTIYLLIGPKGSGKSFIGSFMERQFGIRFVRVENWLKEILGNRDIHDDSYLKECFEIIEKGVRRELIQYDEIVFESTGITKYFSKMLDNLSRQFEVVTIRIMAEPELCLYRVKTRDQKIHINISDDMVKMVNEKVFKNKMKTDFSIENNSKSEEELKIELKQIVRSIRKKNN